MARKSAEFFFAALLLAAAAGAPAATVTATASSGVFGVGDIVTVNLHGDFSSLSTIGGGFDVFFDSSHLAFHSFGFSDAANFMDDPAFRRAPDLLEGELNGIGFGNFDGLGGVFDLAVVQFEILSGGFSQISLAVNEGGPPSNPGGFFDISGSPMSVDFVGTEISSVPLPATIWLFATAGSLLLGFSRNSKAHRNSH